MKKLLLLLSIGFHMASFAQYEVHLKINHQLGNQAFAFNQEASSPESQKFSLTRLQYYISKILLVHDGGQFTPISDSVVFVDAGIPIDALLGNFNITSLEEIRFAVGVNAEVNHNDPSAFPTYSPLYPKSPSMHWGWAAGYRFVALEGSAGSNLNQDMEIHALGDENYLQQIIATQGSLSGQTLTIELNADYTQALKGIDVSQGLIIHGGTDQCVNLLQNFATEVFSSKDGNNAVLHVQDIQKEQISIYPNPSTGSGTLLLTSTSDNKKVEVYDAQGKLQLTKLIQNNKLDLHLPSGMYLIRVTDQNNQLYQVNWMIHE
ncbi:MAG: T9SS type A sorting domain-containing protein [Bacteroidetes bacterium]|nr:T9SS type A sorting domain-containing protein [Bacteroidota bacterium]